MPGISPAYRPASQNIEIGNRHTRLVRWGRFKNLRIKPAAMLELEYQLAAGFDTGYTAGRVCADERACEEM